METRKKVTGVGLLLAVASLIFTGCFQESASAPESARALNSEDPNIAMLVASGIDRAYITVATAPEGDSAYFIEKPVSQEEEKKGYASVRLAFRKKTLDAARARALEAKEVQAKDYSTRTVTAEADEKVSPAVEKVTLPAVASDRAKEVLGKSSQARWDHNTGLWDVKALTEVFQIKVYIQQTGYTKLGANWIAGAREAMTRWNAATGTHVSFVETGDSNNCDLRLRGAFAPSGGSTTWLTPDPWVEKDSVEIYFNIGFETVFPHNQKVAFAMVALGNILNIVHTNAEGATWNGGTFVNIAGTPNNESASLFQTAIGPTVNPVFSDNDLRAIRQMYPAWASNGITSGEQLVSAAWEANVVVGPQEIRSFQVIGDTLLYLGGYNSPLRMRVSPTSSPVDIHGPSLSYHANAFLANGQYIAVRRTTGDIYARPMPGTASNPSWSYKLNIGPVTPFRLSGNTLVYLTYSAGYPAIWAFNLATNAHWVEWSGNPGQTVQDFQLQGSRLFFILDGWMWQKDFGIPGYTQIWANGWANRIQTSESHVAIQAWLYSTPGYASVLTRPLSGGSWTNHWTDVTDPSHFDLCGDKLALIGGGWYLRTYNLTSGAAYDAWHSIDPSATAVRLVGPMCDYVVKISQWDGGSVQTKYSITKATDFFTYQTSVKLEQRPWGP
jgi:hypothetical protein